MNTLTSPHLTVERGKETLTSRQKKETQSEKREEIAIQIKISILQKTEGKKAQKRDGNVNVKKIVYGMKRVQ
jgi:hypothetical protein